MLKRKLIKDMSKRHLRRLAQRESLALKLNSKLTYDTNLCSVESCSSENVQTVDRSIQCRKDAPMAFENDYNDVYTSTGSYECSNNVGQNTDLFFENSYSLEKIDSSINTRAHLGKWAVKYSVLHTAISALLRILQSHKCYNDLPLDARTLLRTPRKLLVKKVHPGEYLHFGILEGIHRICNEEQTNEMNKIDVTINGDGLPLSRSSGSCFWPILGKINTYKIVFLFGLFHGNKKPSDANELLNEFVNDAAFLVENGIELFDRVLPFRIKHIVCDATAKSFLLGVKGHGAYLSCTKCTVEGEYRQKRVCFPPPQARKRSDEDFLNRSDENYHTKQTILQKIPYLGLVTNITLDYMHLVCLGVMRRLIYIWIKGDLKVRLPHRKVEEISTLLDKMRQYIPLEFARKPRSLQYVKVWKATEYRILCSPEYINNEYIDYAENLIQHFIESFGILYGEHYITHNVHNLTQISDDVRNFGCVENYSAFCFENYMQVLKKMVRKSEKPLQQIGCRYAEISKIEIENNREKKSDGFYPCMKSLHTSGPLVKNTTNPQYKRIKSDEFEIKANDRTNGCCILKNGKIIIVSNIAKSTKENKFLMIGKQFERVDNYYEDPCVSSTVNVYKVSKISDYYHAPLEFIQKKVMMIPFNDGYLVLSLLHGREQNLE